MFNTIRLITISFILSLAVAACSDNDQSAPSESSEADMAPATEQAAAPMQDGQMTVAKGTTEQQAVAKLGQPDLTQSHSIDALKITYMEWHKDKGTISAQFHNGVAQFSQFVPAEAK